MAGFLFTYKLQQTDTSSTLTLRYVKVQLTKLANYD